MNFVPVPVLEVDRIWPRVVPGFAKAARRTGGDMSLGWLYQQARTGGLALLLLDDGDGLKGALLVRPDKEALRIVAMWGDGFEHWQDDFFNALAEYGRARFATQTIRFEGSPGYQRLIRRARVTRCIYEVR